MNRIPIHRRGAPCAGATAALAAAVLLIASGVLAQPAPTPIPGRPAGPGLSTGTGRPGGPNDVAAPPSAAAPGPERGGYTGPPAAADPTVQTEAPGAGIGYWPYLLGAAIVLAALIYFAARRRRGGQVIAARSGPRGRG